MAEELSKSESESDSSKSESESSKSESESESESESNNKRPGWDKKWHMYQLSYAGIDPEPEFLYGADSLAEVREIEKKDYQLLYNNYRDGYDGLPKLKNVTIFPQPKRGIMDTTDKDFCFFELPPEDTKLKYVAVSYIQPDCRYLRRH